MVLLSCGHKMPEETTMGGPWASRRYGEQRPALCNEDEGGRDVGQSLIRNISQSQRVVLEKSESLDCPKAIPFQGLFTVLYVS